MMTSVATLFEGRIIDVACHEGVVNDRTTRASSSRIAALRPRIPKKR